MKKIISISFFVLISVFSVRSQIKIDKELIFTSTDSSKRTITGLGSVMDTNDLVPLRDLVRNSLLFSESTGDDTLVLTLPFNYQLSEGTGFWISNSINTDNDPVLTTNGSTYYPLINSEGTGDTNCLKINEIELVIFNGSAFQEIFTGYKICPQGYVSVNSEYCIQISENPSANYWDAMLTCEKDGGKLCSWSEWYYACQNTGLGLLNMTNNWEWSESANNHATSILTLGNGTCKSSGESNSQISTLKPYHCCYRKK